MLLSSDLRISTLPLLLFSFVIAALLLSQFFSSDTQTTVHRWRTAPKNRKAHRHHPHGEDQAVLSTETSNATVNESLPIDLPPAGPSRADLAGNATLGFEKIFVINAPWRSDRRDNMLLVSSDPSQDLRLTFSDGVRGEDVAENARPDGFNTTDQGSEFRGSGELGCWRAHMNAWNKMMDQRLATALFMEDDSDWDVNVKGQMKLLAENIKNIAQVNIDNPAVDGPYGRGWEMLWLGACVWQPAQSDVHQYYDPYTGWTNKLWSTGGQVCLWAYALTLEGARKLTVEVKNEKDPGIDLLMSRWCGEHVCPFVDPPLFRSRVFKGSSNKFSDTRGHLVADVLRDETEGIKHSAMEYVEAKLLGKEDELPYPVSELTVSDEQLAAAAKSDAGVSSQHVAAVAADSIGASDV